MPKIFQICQEFQRAFRGFPILIFNHFSITHQPEMLKSPSNPVKPRTIAYNAFKSREVSRHWFCSIHALPRDADVKDCLQKPIKSCQNNLWFCKHSQKGRNRTAKSFFSAQTTSLSPFWPDLNSSLARSAGEWWPFKKGMFSSPDWGLWVLTFLPIFGVFP